MSKLWTVPLIVVLAVSAQLGVIGEESVCAETRATCRREVAQRFLKRESYVRRRILDGKAHVRAVKWRVETYGTVPGITPAGQGERPVSAQVQSTTFMGLPIALHEKVIPKLRCVERRIKRRCTAPRDRYVPQTIGGVRTVNTSHSGELSNHLFGIAVDIDPNRNPCCHCVEPWPNHPACKAQDKSVYERTELPRCWIRAFEHYGFHWLGDDQLEDTMHFEYLGDPNRR